MGITAGIIISFFKNYIFYINILFVLIIILIEKRNPLYTVFWITILLLTPYLGFFVYLFLGLKFQKRRRAEKSYKWKFYPSRNIVNRSDRSDLFKWRQLISYLEVSAMNKLTSNNDLDIYTEGIDFFDNLKNDLLNAKQSINMEYYIFKYDTIGKEIIDILISKAKEGVRIKIIIDGASYVTNKMLKQLKQSGIIVKRFFPWHIIFIKLANLRVNYRDHRKMTLIDEKIGYTGGFNIGDEYLGKSKAGHWRDIGIRITGDSVRELKKEFNFSWAIVNKREYKVNDPAYKQSRVNKQLSSNNNNNTYVQVVSSGPNYQFRTMRDNYLKIILEAQHYICIQSPYFVPDETILDALRIAATSGVKVQIMIPNNPDHLFMKWVNQYFVGELIDLGVEIYKYNNGFIHSKMIIADDEIASIGTANFDYRSLYQNFEININIYEENIVKKCHKIFTNDISESKKFLRLQYVKRGVWEKFKESVFRLLAPIL